MRKEDINTSALTDPDAAPITEKNFEKVQTISRIKSLRCALYLMQKNFADRCHIPIDTLRDWKQGRVIRNLKIIASDKRALETPSPS